MLWYIILVSGRSTSAAASSSADHIRVRQAHPYLCIHLRLVGHDACQVVHRDVVSILECKFCSLCPGSLYNSTRIR